MGRALLSRDRRALILRRAGQVFLERGFAEASMSTIARAVGGSKATLYTYFDSKGEIFAEFMTGEIGRRVVMTFALPEASNDVEGILRVIGCRYLAMFSDATVVALYRSIICESQRFPEIGRRFMDAGPRIARQMLSHHLAKAVEERLLPITNVEQAAQQFLALCQGNLLPDVLLDAAMAPNRRGIERQVDLALGAFFAIYPPFAAQSRTQQ